MTPNNLFYGGIIVVIFFTVALFTQSDNPLRQCAPFIIPAGLLLAVIGLAKLNRNKVNKSNNNKDN